MEDDVGLEALHHLEHPLALLAVGEHRLDPGEVPLLESSRGRSGRGCPRRGRASTSSFGRTRAIWRQSSEPIEPPAPVTRTILSSQVGADPVELHHHRLAAEHVLDLDLAQLAGELDAAAQQLEDGRQRAHADVALAAGGDDLAAQRRPGAEGIAITTSSGSVSSRISPISSVVPSTLSPSMRMPRLRGSSSTKPIARAPRFGLSCSSRTTIWPPEPAPTTSTPRARRGRRGRGQAARRAPSGRSEPGAAEQDDGEQEVEDHDRARQAVVERLQRAGRSIARIAARDRAGAQHGHHVGEAEVAPPLLVQAEERRRRSACRRRRSRSSRRACVVAVGMPPGASRKRSWKAR